MAGASDGGPAVCFLRYFSYLCRTIKSFEPLLSVKMVVAFFGGCGVDNDAGSYDESNV